MNYFTDFLNREKNKSLDTENLLNRLNPDYDEKKLQTPDNESRLNLLNPEREYSETPPIPPADGLQRRGAFIMPTRETMPAYRAHFEAKADGASTQTAADSDRQTERIRRLAATVTAAELLAAHRTIKPTLKKQLSAIELHELALTLADAQKRENRLRRGENRPAREFIPADELKL
jgi:stress-induced morphogen